LAPTEAIYIEVEELVLEIEMEVEVAAPEVFEVLAEVPKSPSNPRPKPTLTKDTTKDKKGKKPIIPMSASLGRIPLKPAT